jgi:hypothetical protein
MLARSNDANRLAVALAAHRRHIDFEFARKKLAREALF